MSLYSQETDLHSPINERLFFLVWLIINVITFTVGLSHYIALVFVSIPIAITQTIILVWAFGLEWLPWLLLGSITWFYMSYGAPVLAGVFMQIFGVSANSPFYSCFAALSLGLVI